MFELHCAQFLTRLGFAASVGLLRKHPRETDKNTRRTHQNKCQHKTPKHHHHQEHQHKNSTTKTPKHVFPLRVQTQPQQKHNGPPNNMNATLSTMTGLTSSSPQQQNEHDITENTTKSAACQEKQIHSVSRV